MIHGTPFISLMKISDGKRLPTITFMKPDTCHINNIPLSNESGTFTFNPELDVTPSMHVAS